MPERPNPYNLPSEPGFFESYNPRVGERYQAELDLAKQRATLLQNQELNPLRNMSLQQVSTLSDLSPMDLAHPSQMESHPGYQSEVPQSRYVPTLNETPQVRNVPGMAATGMGQMELGPGRQVQPYTTVDGNQPSTLSQQMVGQQAMERLGRWPTGMAGVRNFNNKAGQRALAMETLRTDPNNPMALSIMQMTGGTDNERDSLVNSRQAGTDRSRANVDQGQDRLDETRRMNDWRMRHGDAQDALAIRRFHDGAQRGQASNELGWERLNNTRWYQDNMLRIFGDVDKADRFSDEEQAAFHQGNQLLQKMEHQDLDPKEMTVWQGIKSRLGIKEPPAYQFTPRPRVGPSTGKGPTAAPSAAGAFEGAPAGKAPGDTLKENGKPVAQWDGKAWQRMK